MKKLLLILLIVSNCVLYAQQPDLAQRLSLDFPEKAVAFQNLQTVCVGDSSLLEVLAARPGGIDTNDVFIQKIMTAAESMNGCAGNLITSQNPICPNGFVTMTGSQTLGVTPVTFLWYNGSTAQSQTLSFSAQTNIWVQGTGGDGCAWFADGTIWMASNITATISGNPSFCPGSFTTLTASGGSQVQWTGPNGFTSNSATINVSQPGLYTATVSNGGCSGSASINVTMSPAPTATISGANGFCPNSSVTLTASSNVPGSTFSWSTGQSGPILTTSVGGTYIVTATTTGGCTATTSKTIVAFPAPSPKIKVSYSNNVATLSVSAGLNAVWSTGANTSSITNVPNGLPISVTVTDQQTGCVAASTPVELDLAPCAPPCPLPIANFTFTVNGPLVTFTNTSSGATSYSWLFGDGSNSMEVSPSHAYQPGTYQVKLTATNACGSVETTQTITIQCPPPVANFSFTTNGATATFTNGSTGNGLTYAWDFGDNQTSTLQNPTHTYATAGDYTVTLKVTNSCGVTNQCSKLVSVFFCAPLDAQFNLPQSGGLTLQFTNTSTGTGLTYLWTFGDGGSSTDEDPSHTYAQSGVYLVKLKAFDACGNVDQVVKTLTVLNSPTPATEPSNGGIEFRAYPTLTPSQFWIEGSPGVYFLTGPDGKTKKLIKTE